TRAVHALIRAHAPYADRDRRMDQDIAAVARLISDGSLARAAGAADEREPHAAAS
ncbi:hypothetical protein G3I50_34880, partial [Streptomyces parvus]|nr:hypothetical protein [Streptomyces parvus]